MVFGHLRIVFVNSLLQFELVPMMLYAYKKVSVGVCVSLVAVFLCSLTMVVCQIIVFHPHCGRKLRDMLKDMYPYMVYNVGFQSCGLNSGLAILSRYPISFPTYITHPIRDGDDRYARKGILMVTIETREDHRIVIGTTHLNGGGPNSVAARREQIEHLNNCLDKYVQNQTRNGLVIRSVLQCGDYNIGPMTKTGDPDPEWKANHDYFIILNENYILPEQESQGTTFDFNAPGVGWDMSTINSWKLTAERVDHIMARVDDHLKLQVPKGQLILDRMDGCSDHAAIRGHFVWSPHPQLSSVFSPHSSPPPSLPGLGIFPETYEGTNIIVVPPPVVLTIHTDPSENKMFVPQHR